ncbi:MAG: transketolase family protein [Candidatus Pacebacteria bacterium]|nr:transketolase family protein [Candidatus Paceibacterota bacterium]
MQATRDGFGQGLLAAAQQNDQIVALTADLTESMRLSKFAQQFPDRFIQTGVAEQNMMTVAAGLALRNKIAFVASFAAFNPSLNWAQLRMSVCYSNLNVKVVGGHTGLTIGPDGATHQALEDLALTRVLSNMTVVIPADAYQAAQATQALAQKPGPAYLRLAREPCPKITNAVKFQLGQAQVLRAGTDLTIIACGDLVYRALTAAQELAQAQISTQVINLHTLKPLDRQAIIQAAQDTQAIITVEDHQVIGGLGSAVAEVLAQAVGQQLPRPVPLKIMGVQDQFGESGQAKALLEKYGLGVHNIVNTAKKLLARLESL